MHKEAIIWCSPSVKFKPCPNCIWRIYYIDTFTL